MSDSVAAQELLGEVAGAAGHSGASCDVSIHQNADGVAQVLEEGRQAQGVHAAGDDGGGLLHAQVEVDVAHTCVMLPHVPVSRLLVPPLPTLQQL